MIKINSIVIKSSKYKTKYKTKYTTYRIINSLLSNLHIIYKLSFRLISAIVTITIWNFISFFFFKFAYMHIFSQVDKNFFFGFIIERPIRYSITLILTYLIIKKYKLGFVVFVAVISFLINFNNFLDIVLFLGRLDRVRFLQQIISILITLFFLYLIPFCFYKYSVIKKRKQSLPQ